MLRGQGCRHRVLQLVLPCGKGWHFHSRSLWKQGSPFHNPARGFLPSDELPATAVTYHTLISDTGDHTGLQRIRGDAEPHPAAGFAQSHVGGSAPHLAWILLAIRSPAELPTSPGKSEDSPPGSASLYTPSACRAGYTQRGFCLQYNSTVWRATVRAKYPQKMRLGSRHFWKIDVMRSTILSPHKSRWFSACPV